MFIPKRDEKKAVLNKESKEEVEKNKFFDSLNEEKEETLEKYIRNEKLNEIIKDINENEDKKSTINLAQFKRFYEFLEKNGFEYSDEINNLIDKQKERKVAVKFYKFIEEELKGKTAEENNLKITVLEKYLLYVFGKKRILNNQKENQEVK